MVTRRARSVNFVNRTPRGYQMRIKYSNLWCEGGAAHRTAPHRVFRRTVLRRTVLRRTVRPTPSPPTPVETSVLVRLPPVPYGVADLVEHRDRRADQHVRRRGLAGARM